MLSRHLQTVSLRAAASRSAYVFTPAALRGYAQASAPDSKPPVALYGIDGTYASALVCSQSWLEQKGLTAYGVDAQD